MFGFCVWTHDLEVVDAELNSCAVIPAAAEYFES